MKNLVVPVLALSLLAGCAGQNATAEFQDLEERSGPITGLPYVKQQVARQAGFKLSVLNQQGQASGLSFVVNQEATYLIRAQVVAGLNYEITLDKTPSKDMKLVKKAEGQYALTWKPSGAQVPFGQPNDQFQVTFKLKYDEKSSTPESVLVFKPQKDGGQNQTDKIEQTVTVSRIQGQPTIKFVEATPIPAKISEGEKFAFTVEVADPSADDKNPPRIAAAKVSGIDGSAFVIGDLKSQGLKQSKPGVWTGTYTFQADLSSLPESVKAANKIGETSGSFPVQLGYVIYNAAGGADGATQVKTITFELDKNFEAPKLKLGLPRANTAKRATANKITIIAESSNKRATVGIDIVKLTESLKALPNNPTVECPTKQSTYLQTCTVSWTVPCEVPELQSQYTFTVEATNSLFGEVKTAKQDQVIKLAPVCTLKTAPTTKAKAGNK